MPLPIRTVRVHDLDRLITTPDITSHQPILIPVCSDGDLKSTLSVPLDSFVQWCLDTSMANKSLDNLNATGQAVIDSKRDFFHTIEQDTDFNTFTGDGVYRLNITGAVESHSPVGAGYYIVYVDSNGTDLIEQQARNLTESPGSVYRRQKTGGVWSEWALMTIDLTNPVFLNAPSVLSEGTEKNQVATIGQLENIAGFQANKYITEGVIVSGTPTIAGDVLTVPSGTKYITNATQNITLDSDVVATIDLTKVQYAFIDNVKTIKVFDYFEIVMDAPEITEPGWVYYVFSNNIYIDSDYNQLELCPVGVINSGMLTISKLVQFANTNVVNEIAKKVENKANVDLDNLSETGESKLSGMCLPDYSSPEKTTAKSFTATKNGIAFVYFTVRENYYIVSVNGAQIGYCGGSYNNSDILTIPLSAGDEITWNLDLTAEITFFPFKK